MGSLSNRYCARGEACSQYAALGGPAKLSKYNTAEICEACRSAEASPSEDKKASNTTFFYESGRAVALKALRRDLVAQLCGRQGDFWEAIKEVRGRRSISPVTRIPPDPRTSEFLPDDAPRREQDERAYEEFVYAWYSELNSVIERFIPAKLNDVTVWPRWQDFIAACVLYDPPVPGLVEFADRMTPRGGAVIWGPSPGAGTSVPGLCQLSFATTSSSRV
jgi:hypothetical protein